MLGLAVSCQSSGDNFYGDPADGGSSNQGGSASGAGGASAAGSSSGGQSAGGTANAGTGNVSSGGSSAGNPTGSAGQGGVAQGGASGGAGGEAGYIDAEGGAPACDASANEVCDGLDNNCAGGADEGYAECPVSCTGAMFEATGRGYMFCRATTSFHWNWDEAQAVCQNESPSLSLARIDSKAENDFIVAKAQELDLGDVIWIGANDAAEEGQWVWVSDGTQFYDEADRVAVGKLYNSWLPARPNSDGDEDCAVLSTGTSEESGLWNDLECADYEISFVCEITP